MITPEQKEEVLAAIRQHLLTVGSANWNVVIEKFPHIPVSTMWRWIRLCKEADVPRPELITAAAKIKQKTKKLVVDRTVEAKENGTFEAAKHLPAAPSPQYVAKHGAAAMQQIDFAVELQRLYNDAMMLRAYAIKLDDKGNEFIKNPIMFDKQIARRASLLETGIRALQEIWDLRTMQNFYEVVIEEIGRADAETQHRIIERLAELNARTGMTMHMKV